MLRPENNQVINLTTRYTWSGCAVRTRLKWTAESHRSNPLGSAGPFVPYVRLFPSFNYLFRAKWSAKCFYNILHTLTLPLLMIPVQQRGTRRSMSALTPGFPLSLYYFFFPSSKQLDVFVYHISKGGCQCDSAARWLLLDRFATFQVISECEIYLSVCALASHSTVII